VATATFASLFAALRNSYSARASSAPPQWANQPRRNEPPQPFRHGPARPRASPWANLSYVALLPESSPPAPRPHPMQPSGSPEPADAHRVPNATPCATAAPAPAAPRHPCLAGRATEPIPAWQQGQVRPPQPRPDPEMSPAQPAAQRRGESVRQSHSRLSAWRIPSKPTRPACHPTLTIRFTPHPGSAALWSNAARPHSFAPRHRGSSSTSPPPPPAGPACGSWPPPASEPCPALSPEN
jgi:hypothetical protein